MPDKLPPDYNNKIVLVGDWPYTADAPPFYPRRRRWPGAWVEAVVPVPRGIMVQLQHSRSNSASAAYVLVLTLEPNPLWDYDQGRWIVPSGDDRRDRQTGIYVADMERASKEVLTYFLNKRTDRYYIVLIHDELTDQLDVRKDLERMGYRVEYWEVTK